MITSCYARQFDNPHEKYLEKWKFRLNAPFNNMWTLKFKAQPRNAFFATVNQNNVRRLLPIFKYRRALFCCLNCAQRFDYRAFGSSRNQGGAAEHLINSNDKRISRLSLNFRVRMLLKGAANLAQRVSVYAQYAQF